MGGGGAGITVTRGRVDIIIQDTPNQIDDVSQNITRLSHGQIWQLITNLIIGPSTNRSCAPVAVQRDGESHLGQECPILLIRIIRAGFGPSGLKNRDNNTNNNI